MNGLEHKTVVLTGALGGIARAVIQLLDAYRVNFILMDVVEEDKAFLGSLSSRAHYFQTDISSPEAIAVVTKQALKLYPQVDFIIHAAGLYQHIELVDLSFEQWNHQINVNLNANYYLIKSFLPYLSAQSAIVNISSIAGHQGSNAHTAYAAAKGGVISLTKSLAIELAPRTRVNTVSPGLIDTSMMQGMTDDKRQIMINTTPLKRLGQPQEIAEVIAFLCSSGASYITGENIHVNGGLYRD
ncbi:SDR family NAD(P)-dependent oxidoreductase [Acinetobacter gerneri]|uniref:SDR family NAD(P)-dependent oxidoreductase n=1 Tax=Acinetobacter gerneri TaxID=202952 RepID=UPI0029361243|nr:SDR family NAD(P)-dependent oxidoreductase [Acinetobacter gerneri]MDV2439503.1 SDR family NAD(P)-dependent oxidoreductase [Acinetobacter gerneri]